MDQSAFAGVGPDATITSSEDLSDSYKSSCLRLPSSVTNAIGSYLSKALYPLFARTS